MVPIKTNSMTVVVKQMKTFVFPFMTTLFDAYQSVCYKF